MRRTSPPSRSTLDNNSCFVTPDAPIDEIGQQQMIGESLSSSKHRTVVAVDKETKQLIGHAIFSLKVDSEGRRFERNGL